MALAVAAGVAVYLPILGNYFHTEDFDVLHSIANQPFVKWALTPSAGHLLVVRNLIFAGMYAAARGNPVPYFVSVLLVHAINTALLFAIIHAATHNARLACVGALAWAVSPVNEGTLGWYTYCCHALVTLVVLIVLLRMVRRALDVGPVPPREAALWVLLTLVGALTHGFGLGPALMLPVLAFLLFRSRRLSWTAWLVLLALPVGLPVLYAFLVRGTASQLVASPRDIVAMLFHLVAFGITTLVGNFAFRLADYPSATAYGIAAVAVATCVIGFVLGEASSRRLLLSVGLLAGAVYGMVALGRASLYGSIPSIPVYGATLPRYHYLVTALMAIAICVALAQVGRRARIGEQWRGLLLAAYFVVAAVFYWRSDWSIDHFDDERAAAETAVEGIRSAVERTALDQTVLILNEPIPSAGLAPYFGGWADIYTIYFRRPLDRPILFIDRSALWWDGALGDSPLTRLLVPPPERRTGDVETPVRLPLMCAAT